MSYILDALKRASAERERERGAVPGLNTQPLGQNPLASSRTPVWPWVVGAVGLLLTGGWVLSLWLSDSAPQAPLLHFGPRLTAPAAQAPATPLPPPAPALVVVNPESGGTPLATPAPTVAPGPSLTPASAAPISPRAAVPETSRPRRSDAAAPSAPPAPPLEQLPPELRTQLPAFTVSGATYSDNPALRLLVINGQVLQQGQRVAPELVLEEIQPKTAVLSFRGRRFTLHY